MKSGTKIIGEVEEAMAKVGFKAEGQDAAWGRLVTRVRDAESVLDDIWALIDGKEVGSDTICAIADRLEGLYGAPRDPNDDAAEADD